MQTEVADRNRQQMLAYREMTDDDLFTTQWVKVETASKNFRIQRRKNCVCYGEEKSTSAAKSGATAKCCAAAAPGIVITNYSSKHHHFQTLSS